MRLEIRKLIQNLFLITFLACFLFFFFNLKSTERGREEITTERIEKELRSSASVNHSSTVCDNTCQKDYLPAYLDISQCPNEKSLADFDLKFLFG